VTVEAFTLVGAFTVTAQLAAPAPVTIDLAALAI
jgi:hypothetical protein